MDIDDASCDLVRDYLTNLTKDISQQIMSHCAIDTLCTLLCVSKKFHSPTLEDTLNIDVLMFKRHEEIGKIPRQEIILYLPHKTANCISKTSGDVYMQPSSIHILTTSYPITERYRNIISIGIVDVHVHLDGRMIIYSLSENIKNEINETERSAITRGSIALPKSVLIDRFHVGKTQIAFTTKEGNAAVIDIDDDAYSTQSLSDDTFIDLRSCIPNGGTHSVWIFLTKKGKIWTWQGQFKEHKLDYHVAGITSDPEQNIFYFATLRGNVYQLALSKVGTLFTDKIDGLRDIRFLHYRDADLFVMDGEGKMSKLNERTGRITENVQPVYHKCDSQKDYREYISIEYSDLVGIRRIMFF